MYMIVGLGNPGREYENTKHNVGFVTIDQFALRHQVTVRRLKHKALTGEARICGQKVMLVKPQTYMNLSGESVAALIRYYDIPMERLIIVYDDVDIPLGRLRIRKNGSAGTHNGMRSVIGHLGDDSFLRFRLGIGGDRGRIPLHDYVLGGFSKQEAEAMESAILRAVSALETTLEQGVDLAMNRYNG